MKREGGRTGSGERSRTVAAHLLSAPTVGGYRKLDSLSLTVGADGGRALYEYRGG